MKAKFSLIFIGFVFCLTACGQASTNENALSNAQTANINKVEAGSAKENQNSIESNDSGKTEIAESQSHQPKTVRDFFMLLPPEYFIVVCCDKKEEYLEKFINIEDTANGYLKGGAEAGQNGLEMTLFKRPNGTYIVGLYSFGEVQDDFYFLEYRGGKLFNVSKQVVPDYGKNRWYELPRYGTTIKVFRKQLDDDEDPNFTAGKPAEKLYDLEWKDGKFSIKK